MSNTGIKYSLSIAAVMLLKPLHGRSNNFACFEFSGPCLCVETNEFVDSLGEFRVYVNLDLYSCTEKSGVCEEEGRRGGKRGRRGEEFTGYF